MSTYLIGDVHGCIDELKIILEKVKFNPTQDTLWLTGDLVSRGLYSLEVLRLVYNLGNSVRIVLGNHDLHLLAVYAGIRKSKQKERIASLLAASDADKLINWLRKQPILQVDEEKKLIMTHAGIMPQWDLLTARQCARDVEAVLKSDSYPLLLDAMYNNNTSDKWNSKLSGLARLRFSTNVFTRMRYCFPSGNLEMNYKDIPEKAPTQIQPWFTISSPISKCYSIVFGHWASLMGKGTPKNIYGLDTGCCWGGKLTLLHWEKKILIYVPSRC